LLELSQVQDGSTDTIMNVDKQAMNFETLCDFIRTKMRMSHIYQPLLIKSLIECDNTATLRQLAHSFLSQDESQLLYYEDRIKKMPVPVLKRHGVIERDGNIVHLPIGKLSFKEKSQIKALCDAKIQEFLERRGLATWDYRLLESQPVPDTIRYTVLKRAGGKCELCGCSAKERPLHVDHILPRSKGGKNDLSNLQALCDRCNLAKGNRDDTDFRIKASDRLKGCTFCSDKIQDRTVEANGSVYAVRDKFPVSDGHTLIIPFRHVSDFFSLTEHERRDSDDLARYLKNSIQTEDEQVVGFNVGYNCGEAAGQTVFHSHLHLIPRRSGDMERPEGGVRGVIPEKMKYGQ
jgi:ATP adenylyltransferase